MGKSHSIVFVLSGILALSGCSAKRKLDEMHDSTKNMDKTTTSMADTTKRMEEVTREMNETTKGMAETTKGMDETTRNTYKDLRQGSSAVTVNEFQKAMQDAQTLDAKVVKAGEMIMALEFQLLKTKGDPVSDHEHVYETSVKDFLSIVANYMDKKPKIKIGENGNMENLYALSAVLHRVNPNQVEQAALNGVVAPSIYSLIKEALIMGEEIKAGKRDFRKIPAWAREVLRQENTVVIYLLNLRYNFLISMPLAKVSDISKKGFLNKLGMLLRPWDAEIENLNATELEYECMKFEYGLETRDFLTSIGREVVTDKNLRKIYSKMRLDENSARSAGKAGAELAVRFKNNVSNFLNGKKVD